MFEVVELLVMMYLMRENVNDSGFCELMKQIINKKLLLLVVVVVVVVMVNE